MSEQILEYLEQGGLAINRPQSLRDANEKAFVAWFPDCVPPRGDHRGNLVTGARAEVRPLTDRDRWICERVGPVLRDRGLLFTGIDVIGDFMTELNVTSPTGIRELERASEERISERILDAIDQRIRQQS